MKKIGLVTCLFLFTLITTKAQSYKTALGVRFSSRDAIVNNSITFKHFFSNNTAVEALFTFTDPVALGLLIERHRFLGGSGLSWFYGAGAYVAFNRRNRFGAQGALGLDFKVPTIPINLSLDWKPELNFTEDFYFEPSVVGVSARFTF